jgi:GNAT superfamily N-acetyltransferase
MTIKPPSSIAVRRAVPADVPDLGVVGPAAYAAAYGHLSDDGAEFARHLTTFSADAFEAFLNRPDTGVWVAEANGTIVGFLSMIVGSANPITHEPNGAEIPRIYLLPVAQGVGFGRRLLDAAITEAEGRSLNHVWLDVMGSADTARKAYLSWGFLELGAKRFSKAVKADMDNMVVLIRYLR